MSSGIKGELIKSALGHHFRPTVSTFYNGDIHPKYFQEPMELTNNLGLPMPLFRAIDWQGKQHSVGDAELSCTQLIDSPLIAWLYRHHGHEVVEEASDRLWALYGTLMHKLLEDFAGDGEHVETEAIANVDGMNISGHIDLVVTADSVLQDYKFTSAWTVKAAKENGKIEWERQENVYLYLLKNAINDLGITPLPDIKQLQIVAMLRDYGHRHKRDGLKPVEIIDIPIWKPERIEQYMKERVAAHRAAMTDEMPSVCSADERWATPTTYAVMKKNRKSALKVAQTHHEAELWMEANSKGEWIEERPGENKRCQDYCVFGKQKICPYFF